MKTGEEIKQMYYPIKENFDMKSMEVLRETAGLIIPKVSSNIFSDDIQSQFDELQKNITKDAPLNERRNILLRRLSESKLNKKRIKTDKIRKRKIRILQENNGEEQDNKDENETKIHKNRTNIKKIKFNF